MWEASEIKKDYNRVPSKPFRDSSDDDENLMNVDESLIHVPRTELWAFSTSRKKDKKCLKALTPIF